MKPIASLTALLLLTFAATAHAGPPTRFLETQVDTVRALLKNPPKDGTPEAVALDDKLKAIVNPVMDFERLSQNVLTKHWPTLSPGQRTAFVDLFRALVFTSYLKEIRSANEDYSVVYEDEEAKGRKAAAVTAIAKTKKVEIELVFHLVTVDGQVWVAEDVVIDEVSLVENYREQFNKIIADKGFSALLDKMKEKLVDLGGKVPETAAVKAASPGEAVMKAAPAAPATAPK